MKHRSTILTSVAVLSIFVMFMLGTMNGIHRAGAEEKKESSKLFVLWTSADRDVAIKKVYMYTYYAKKNGWWDGG